MHLEALFERVGPILGFLVCITVVAELADRIGLFDVLAREAARIARGSVVGLWLLVVLVGSVSSAVLSLDTTAVLITPVVLVLARQLGLSQSLFAYTAVWLANTASLVLPVSNLTNLLAWNRLGGGIFRFAEVMWPAALAALLITVGFAAVVFRRELRGRYQQPPEVHVEDKPLLITAGVVCGGLGPAFALGVDVTLAAAVGAVIMVVACLVRNRSHLSWKLLPWQLVVGVSVLFVVVQFAQEHGLSTVLGYAAGHGERWLDLLRLSGISAASANVVDNLPAYLALEPLADTPQRIAALLIGVNAGPLILPWASLATLLWAGRCRAAGVSVNWRTFALRGLVLVPLLVVGCVSATALLG
ncbi:arsenical pump membrane protein [Friedmanniella endophytica]|uniref:Arsenical pump membrane protein n=1 Tax=Microlunatus kandeliicorticis TaxID=1759536 RepID=A0A7W3ITH5_9ACTN|nr:SLC13 family permease [Microlunatus kandeliicorticis]MBA8794957.1 arsenical pump membrane protein [Microlunatus kandeliicorticis]